MKGGGSGWFILYNFDFNRRKCLEFGGKYWCLRRELYLAVIKLQFKLLTIMVNQQNISSPKLVIFNHFKTMINVSNLC